MLVGICASTYAGVIGSKNKTPWHIPEELKLFQKITYDSVIIMGRKTFDSIGKPLPNRINIILTKNKNLSLSQCVVYTDFKKILNKYKQSKNKIFIIGGKQIYTLFNQYLDMWYISWIKREYQGEIKIEWNGWLQNFNKVLEKDYGKFIHCQYVRRK